jgi:adenylate cyclase
MADRAESENPSSAIEATAGPARLLFISYASRDAEVAQKVCSALEGAGSPCWIAPRDVRAGTVYADAIVRAINEAKALVLMLSANAMASSHVGREVERAASKRKQIIAFRIDAAPLSTELEYFLSNSQWIDVPLLGMPAALAKLGEAVGQGSAPAGQAAPAGNRAGRSKKRIAIAAAIIVAVGVAIALGVHLWSSSQGGAEGPALSPTSGPAGNAPASVAISEKSIAVLPFVDMSEKKDQEYFADGMAEEIIDLLAKVPDLHVPARTSSFYFKGKATKVPDIARELGVAHVLEGSVRQSGSHIRVTAQLVRADTGFSLWSETYDRDLHDVFKVQDEIANAVVQELQIGLLGGPLTRQAGGTQNLEAYNFYLRATSDSFQNTKQSLVAAGEYLERAIKIDPQFGLGYIELAEVLIQQTDNSMLPVKDGFERARQLALRTIQLSPKLAAPHAVLSYVYRTYDWNWTAAEIEAHRALEADSTDRLSLQFTGMLFSTLGRWEEAVKTFRTGLDRDPLNTYTRWNLAEALYRAGRFGDAEREYRRVMEIAPGFTWTIVYLSKTLLVEGKSDAALEMVLREREEEDRLGFLPMILQAVGRGAESDAALKALIAKFADTDAYMVAMNYAYRGDRDQAIQWLDRAYRQRDIDLVEIVGEPLFKKIADDPRFKAFLRKMNLPE